MRGFVAMNIAVAGADTGIAGVVDVVAAGVEHAVVAADVVEVGRVAAVAIVEPINAAGAGARVTPDVVSTRKWSLSRSLTRRVGTRYSCSCLGAVRRPPSGADAGCGGEKERVVEMGARCTGRSKAEEEKVRCMVHGAKRGR
jgi:hypothetical protein